MIEPTQTPIRILIADDHAVVREGLRALIEAKPDMELVGEAEDGVEAVLMARSLKPDVILLDLLMPRMDGIEAIGEIRQENPHARILILTSFAADDKVFPAIKAGALGYLLKDSSSQALIQAIREVYQGESSLHPTIARKLIREILRPSTAAPAENLLTEREVAVLKLIAGGLSNQEIAETLVISQRTVSSHVSNILEKLHLANRTQAAVYALREGLASLGQRAEDGE
jgi:NarL family two-component system response regulator LiaR